jgi:hypothetical protein
MICIAVLQAAVADGKLDASFNMQSHLRALINSDHVCIAQKRYHQLEGTSSCQDSSLCDPDLGELSQWPRAPTRSAE